MKTIRIIPLVVALLFSLSLMAQEESGEMKTLFNKSSDKKMSNGGYGSFSIGYTQIDNKDALLLGGRVAWIANHRFALGFAGNGFFNSVQKSYNSIDDPSEYFLTGGYGGLFFEPILMPNKPVHVSFPIMLGAGGVTAVQSENWTSSYNNHQVNYYDADAFFVFEPGVDIEFNIVKFFRVALGASYRLTNGVDLKYKYLDPNDNYNEKIITVNKNALNAFNFNIGFKFGWF